MCPYCSAHLPACTPQVLGWSEMQDFASLRAAMLRAAKSCCLSDDASPAKYIRWQALQLQPPTEAGAGSGRAEAAEEVAIRGRAAVRAMQVSVCGWTLLAPCARGHGQL